TVQLGILRLQFSQFLKAFEGIVLAGNSVVKGEYPGSVHKRRHGPQFNVELVFVLSSPLHNKIAEKAQRRRTLQRMLRQERQENALLLNVVVDVVCELPAQAEIAVHRSVIVENGGMHQRLLGGLVY